MSLLQRLTRVGQTLRHGSTAAFSATMVAVRRAVSSTAATTAPVRVPTATTTPALRRLSSSPAADAADKALKTPYAMPLQLLHWGMAAGIITCVATVKLQQWTDDKKKKGEYMHIHKSTALLVLGMLPLRLMYGIASKTPHLPGNALMVAAGRLSHYALYGLMIVLPLSGVAMGYFGGKGLPFFSTHIAGAPEGETKPEVAKQAYNIHKKMGVVLEYFIPLHIGGSLVHVLMGQNVFKRVGLGLLSSFGIVQVPGADSDCAPDTDDDDDDVTSSPL